jgi:hypothetical protein
MIELSEPAQAQRLGREIKDESESGTDDRSFA